MWFIMLEFVININLKNTNTEIFDDYLKEDFHLKLEISLHLQNTICVSSQSRFYFSLVKHTSVSPYSRF